MFESIGSFIGSIINGWILIAIILFALGLVLGHGDQRILKGYCALTYALIAAGVENIFKLIGPLLREVIYGLSYLVLWMLSNCMNICKSPAAQSKIFPSLSPNFFGFPPPSTNAPPFSSGSNNAAPYFTSAETPSGASTSAPYPTSAETPSGASTSAPYPTSAETPSGASTSAPYPTSAETPSGTSNFQTNPYDADIEPEIM